MEERCGSEYMKEAFGNGDRNQRLSECEQIPKTLADIEIYP